MAETDLTANDPEALGRAARAGMRALVLAELTSRGLLDSPDLQECPVCGEKTIHPAVAATFMKDRALDALICASCGTERSVLRMVLPDHLDVGGESG
jgi:hypothetical protein